MDDVKVWLREEMMKALLEEIKSNSEFQCLIKEKHPAHWWEFVEGWTKEAHITNEWCIGRPTAQWNLSGIVKEKRND